MTLGERPLRSPPRFFVPTPRPRRALGAWIGLAALLGAALAIGVIALS